VNFQEHVAIQVERFAERIDLGAVDDWIEAAAGVEEHSFEHAVEVRGDDRAVGNISQERDVFQAVGLDVVAAETLPDQIVKGTISQMVFQQLRGIFVPAGIGALLDLRVDADRTGAAQQEIGPAPESRRR